MHARLTAASTVAASGAGPMHLPSEYKDGTKCDLVDRGCLTLLLPHLLTHTRTRTYIHIHTLSLCL